MHLLADRRLVAAAIARSAAARGERNLAAWILLAAVFALAALALPFFAGRVYVADDLGEFHLPLRNFYAEQLAGGEPFDWMPSLYGGFYVTAEGQLGAYHPLHLLLYRCLPLGAAFDLELLLSYPFMFAGTYLLLRRWLGRRDAAMFGALAFTFGGFNLLHFVHPNAIAIVAHIPWLLLAVEAAFTLPRGPGRATATLAVGLLTASQLLLGYPQYVWFSLLVVTAYAAWRAVGLKLPVTRIAVLLLALVLGMLTAAVQWLPTLDALGDSTRSTADAAFSNSGALHPLNLVQLVAPYLFETRVVGQNTHELGLYDGAAPLLLCVWLLAQRRRWGRYAPLAWAVLVFGAAALLLAFGQQGGLYRVQEFLPLANRFRFPCRAVVLVQLCLATAAATAIAIMRQPDAQTGPGDRRRTLRVLAIAVAASLAAAIVGPMLWPEYVATPLLVWAGPALIGVAAVLVALAERNVRGAFVALALFTTVDLLSYGLSYSVWSHTAGLRQFVADVPLPPGGPGARVAVKATGGLRTGNRILLAGLTRVDGYAGLEPSRWLDRSTTAALQLAGAGYLLVADSNDNDNDNDNAGPWLSIEQTAPRVRLVSRTVPLAEWRGATAMGLETARLDEPIELPPSQPGPARVVADRPGQITVEYSAPARQLLVTTESFHRGWRATVDGRDRPVVRVNGDFLGCVVDAGNHEVLLGFRPRSLILGLVVSACGLGLLLCTFALQARRPSSRRD